MREAVEAHGDVFTIWLTRDFTGADLRAAVLDCGASGVIAEGEVPAYSQGQPNPQAPDWQEVADSVDDLDIHKAVATSWSPFQGPTGLPVAELAAPLIRAGWHVQPYCYAPEHPGITPEHGAMYAQHYTHEAAPTALDPGQGWYHTEPVFGCYRGIGGPWRIEDYETRDNYRGWSAWAAEYVL